MKNPSKNRNQQISSSKWFWFLQPLGWQNWHISVLFSLSHKPCPALPVFVIQPYNTVNTKATQYGQKHESDAIKAYETYMKVCHVNLEVKECALFINKENSFLHATPDFLALCDCCGSGCEEVKCPMVSTDGNFNDYVQHKSSCLEKVNWNLQLKRNHSYYYQVQTQVFSDLNLQYDDFVVCAIDKVIIIITNSYITQIQSEHVQMHVTI